MFRDQLRHYRMLANVYFTRMILGQIPRLIFGNDAGLRENLVGQREINRASRITDQKLPPNREAEILKDQGFLVLGKEFDRELIQTIKKKYLKMISDAEQQGKSKYTNFSDIHREIPEIKQLLTPKINSLLESYYEGAHFWLMSIQAWRNYHWPEAQNNTDINSNLWHNDATPTNILKLFVFLSDDVTHDNGATKILSISDTKKVMRSGYWERKYISRRGRKILANEELINFMEGETGTTFIFNPQLCVHAAGVAKPDTYRDALCLQFAPTAIPRPVEWEQTVGDRKRAESYL
jgi:hypothetical protein